MNRMKTSIVCAIATLFNMTGCNGNKTQESNTDPTAMSSSQGHLITVGWYIPNTVIEGELPKEYVGKSKFGQQDNYFDIEIGNGCDVAVKIVEASADKCIRYVHVAENSSVNVQMISQGKYYQNSPMARTGWSMIMAMEHYPVNLRRMFFMTEALIFSIFWEKDLSNIVSYLLQINVVNCNLQNNFGTTEISEDDFMK